jgi:DNA modification methylase
MESRVIQLTNAAQKHGNVNIAPCGKDFFPADVFGGSSRAKGLGVPITLRVKGVPDLIETDIPTDGKTRRPRWIFRERGWVKAFLCSNELVAGDTITINRVAKRIYEISPGNHKVQRAEQKPSPYYETSLGQMYLGDSLKILEKIVAPASVDLIVTSPPFGLVRKKNYGNVDADKYVEWFKPFGKLFRHLLKQTGSLVIDIGGSWNPGLPTRSLYVYELLLTLCRECGFHLAQEFFWWNPSKLPSPAEWVTVRRIRVKDAVNYIWWLSVTPWPKGSNRRVLTPYSSSMHDLLRNGYKAKLRPSGHDISEKFSVDNRASIPPNLIAVANTESNSYYLRYCKEQGLEPNPARFPREIPEYFIRMLSDPGDVVLDPFAGSCVTGEVAERLKRKWLCVEIVEDYLRGGTARFKDGATLFPVPNKSSREKNYYKIYHPAARWNSEDNKRLSEDGGKKRHKRNS